MTACAKLVARGERQSEVAQASCDDEADPAEPHRRGPASDHDRLTHVNAQCMQQRHQREDYAGEDGEGFLIHGSMLQDQAVAAVE